MRDASGILSVAPLPIPTSAYSRDEVDYFNDYVSGLAPTPRPGVRGATYEELAKESAARYGAELRKELDARLEGYQIKREPSVPLADLVSILHRLASDNDYYSLVKEHPEVLKRVIPSGVHYVQFPSPERAVTTAPPGGGGAETSG